MLTVLAWVAAAAVLLVLAFFARRLRRRRVAYLAHLDKVHEGHTLVSLVRNETSSTYDWYAYYSNGTYVNLLRDPVQPEWTNGMEFEAIGQSMGFTPDQSGRNWTREGIVLASSNQRPSEPL